MAGGGWDGLRGGKAEVTCHDEEEHSQAKAGEKTHDGRTYRSSVRDEWKSKSAVFQKHTALGVFRIFPQTKAL